MNISANPNLEPDLDNSSASAVSGALSPDVRREQVLRLLADQPEYSVDALAEYFGVSGMTIRRDLQELTATGQIVRTHGGAVLADHVSFEFRFLERTDRCPREKEQVARLAATLVKPGQSVLLDSGTTTLAIARALRDVPGVTVATTSLPIASVLYGSRDTEVILLGGALRKDSPDLVGVFTEYCLEMLQADMAFIGADAVDEKGNIYNRSPELGQLLRRMPQAVKKVYAVADHTKIGQTELIRFGQVAKWEALITDAGLDRKLRRKLERAGVNVLQADADQ